MVAGQIVESGGPELAQELEDGGYSRFVDADEETAGVSVAIGGRSETKNAAVSDSEDPFADPLA